MSKILGKLKKIGKTSKKLVEKIDHSSKLRVNIPAGLASAAPPLGSQLGQVRITPNFNRMYSIYSLSLS